MDDIMKLSCFDHIAAASGMPTLVVFAAPQKQTAITSSLDILFTVNARLNTPGRREPILDPAMHLFNIATTGWGGYAI